MGWEATDAISFLFSKSPLLNSLQHKALVPVSPLLGIVYSFPPGAAFRILETAVSIE